MRDPEEATMSRDGSSKNAQARSDWSWLPEAKKAVRMGYKIGFGQGLLSLPVMAFKEGYDPIHLGRVRIELSDIKFRLNWIEKL
jgi:hypothetical protein